VGLVEKKNPGNQGDRRGRIIAGCIVLSLLIHLGIVLAAPHNEPKTIELTKKPQKRVSVTVKKERVRLLEEEAKKPEPIKEKEPEKKPPPPKKPEPEKAEPKKPEPVKAPPKAVDKPPEPPPEPAKPAPFVLKNLALKGGVAVQAGENSNLFGDPSVDAKGFKKGQDMPFQPGGDGDGTGGKGRGGSGEPAVVITQPKALNDVKGEYPPSLRDLNKIVRVELVLTIGADGLVKAVAVKKGAQQEFNDAAEKAVKQLRFEPATRNGTPITFRIKWTVVFIPEGN
jgi:TonB family protein